LDLKFFTNKTARNLKNPTSSKNIDRNVIEKNNNNILIGFIIELENKPFITSLIEIQLNNKANIAPIALIIQKVLISLLKTFIFGNSNIDKINIRQVINEIIIVATILFLPLNQKKLYS
jgi:hypothetical protein